MTNFVRILLFVPPILLSLQSFAQLQGKIELLPDETTYQVSIISSVDWVPPLSITNNAQITLRAPIGSLEITNFQSITGNWDGIATISSPDEALDFDYFSFGLVAPLTMVEYLQSEELVLFTFENINDCSSVELFDNETDPFAPPNSLNLNIGNVFTILGAGPGQNGYDVNSGDFQVICPTTPELDLVFNFQNQSLLCAGDSTNLNLEIIGGEPPYQISWENTNNGSNQYIEVTDFEGVANISNLPAGDYIFQITDNQGNNLISNEIISEPSPISLDINTNNASCPGSMDGEIHLENISGGTVNQDYQLNISGLQATASSFFNVNPGQYILEVTDDNNCQTNFEIVIESDGIIEANVMIDPVKCSGTATGAFEIFPSGTNPPFSIQWEGQNQTGINNSNSNLSSGNYNFTITDATGVCNLVDTLLIEENAPMEIFFSIISPPCDDQSLASIHIDSVLNASLPVLSSLDGASYFQKTTFSVPAGDYFTLFVQDAENCEIAEEIFIAKPEPIVIEIEEKEMDLVLGDSVELKVNSNRDDLMYVWSPSSTLSCSDCPNPMAKPLETTVYQLIAQDSMGCSETDQAMVLVKKDRSYFVPNVFSPNQDGENDILFVMAEGNVKEIKSFEVFTRWGNKVFNSPNNFYPNDPSKGWDGNFNGEPLKSGVYIYQIKVEYQDGIVETESGTINLLR